MKKIKNEIPNQVDLVIALFETLNEILGGKGVVSQEAYNLVSRLASTIISDNQQNDYQSNQKKISCFK